jgi:prevent-host-death family protein
MAAMKTITMREFRLHAEEILARVQQGERITLTRRGKPVARLEPVRQDRPRTDDLFYSLHELADERGDSLTNTRIDNLLYGR